jgi:hypothetical protein
MRADALGLFWQDMPKIKLIKEDEKYLPPYPTWEKASYLPFLKESLEFKVDLMTESDLIASQISGNVLTFDIESYINYFLIAFRDEETRKVIYFERIADSDGMSNWNADPRKLIWIFQSFTLVGFNSINYDMTVAALAIAEKSVAQMKAATNMLIAEGYKPWQVLKKLKLKKIDSDHIDIMEVAPLAGSLKIYGGRAGVRRMQDLPFHPSTVLSSDQIAITRFYCVNDLDTTGLLYSKLLKDIKLRKEMSAQYGVDLRSKSDAQIAEAVIAHELEKVLIHPPRKPIIEPGTVYKYKVPGWMAFQTPLMQSVQKLLSETLFVVSEKGSVGLPPHLANMKLRIGNSTYTMGIGGLHSNERSTSHFSNENVQLSDHDATSFYPFIILNNELFPQHLGRPFLTVFRTIVMTRLKAKDSAAEFFEKSRNETDETLKAEYLRKAKDFQRTADSLKIVINGTFGKLGSMWSIFYSPDLLIQTTITGQLSLLMLIEMFELNGIPVVSANTDGIVVKCPVSKFAVRDQILKAWEDTTNFNLEANFYSALCSKDVNNYFAVKSNGDVKGKGAYSDPGLRKNPTTTICAQAAAEFLKNGTPVEDFINKSSSINDFVSVRNVKGGAVSVTYRDTGEEGKVDLTTMKDQLLRTGWVEYEGGSWIKQEWIDDHKAYDRMAVSLRNAYNEARWTPIHHEFLGKAVRWYYATQDTGMHTRLLYAKNGNKVPKSDCAKPLMELPLNNALPSDIDLEWYYSEAKRILKDVGHPKYKVEK